MDNDEYELEARKKRVAEKKWCRMIDLPGFKEWSVGYVGLEKIIPNLKDYNVLVHPDEIDRPLDWIFEREYRGWLADFAERGGLRRDLNDFKKS
jgi:hypothetical protein